MSQGLPATPAAAFPESGMFEGSPVCKGLLPDPYAYWPLLSVVTYSFEDPDDWDEGLLSEVRGFLGQWSQPLSPWTGEPYFALIEGGQPGDPNHIEIRVREDAGGTWTVCAGPDPGDLYIEVEKQVAEQGKTGELKVDVNVGLWIGHEMGHALGLTHAGTLEDMAWFRGAATGAWPWDTEGLSRDGLLSPVMATCWDVPKQGQFPPSHSFDTLAPRPDDHSAIHRNWSLRDPQADPQWAWADWYGSYATSNPGFELGTWTWKWYREGGGQPVTVESYGSALPKFGNRMLLWDPTSPDDLLSWEGTIDKGLGDTQVALATEIAVRPLSETSVPYSVGTYVGRLSYETDDPPCDESYGQGYQMNDEFVVERVFKQASIDSAAGSSSWSGTMTLGAEHPDWEADPAHMPGDWQGAWMWQVLSSSDQDLLVDDFAVSVDDGFDSGTGE